MPPRREPPTLEESMAAMVENISKLIHSSSANTERIITTQAAALQDQKTQLDIIVNQLAAQYEQTTTLIATLAHNEPKTPNRNNPPPPPHGYQLRPPKLTLPVFDGSRPLDWLFQADQYFSFYNIDPPQRLAMVSFNLSGDALSWYKYLYNNGLLTTWQAFTRDLETRFGPSSYDNHQAALFKLCQTSTVTDYQTEFERLSNCIISLPPAALLNCFISGLRTDIQQELAIQKPTSIVQAIGLAKLIEDKANDQRFRPKPPPPYNTTASSTQPSLPSASPAPNQPHTSALLPTPPTTTPSLPLNRLSAEALQKRRAAGLCFRCPEKYHPGHKCNPPQFLLLAENEELATPPPLIDLHDDTVPNPDPATPVHLDTHPHFAHPLAYHHAGP